MSLRGDLYQSASAVITTYHRQGGLKDKNQGVRRADVFLRFLSLAGWWLSSPCIFTVSSFCPCLYPNFSFLLPPPPPIMYFFILFFFRFASFNGGGNRRHHYLHCASGGMLINILALLESKLEKYCLFFP